jgi:amino acid transporter
MLKDTWKSVLTWSSISTTVFFILFFIFSPYMDKSFMGIITVIGALFFASFTIITITGIILFQVKEYRAQDKRGKIIMIIIILFAIAYVLPKALADF